MLYFFRAFKFFLYACVLCLLLFALVFFTSDHGDLTFWELTPLENYWKMALFLVVFAGVYPLFRFTTRKVYLNRPFAEDRDMLLEPILHANYKIERTEDQKIILRPKSQLTRFIQLYDDHITIDFSDNPILLIGLRKDVLRFARSMEYLVRQL